MVDFVERGCIRRRMAVERIGVGLEGKEATLNVGQPISGEGFEMREIVGSEKAARRVGVIARLAGLIEPWNGDGFALAAIFWP